MTAPADLELRVVESDRLDDAARATLRELWDAAFTDGFSDEDAAHAYGGVHVVARRGGEVVGHASAVPRAIRIGEAWWAAGYVEAVATRPAHQGSGVGTAMMRLLQEHLAALWEVGFLSTGSHEFYRRLGWERWRGPTYVAASSGLLRTPEEDDGLMVLRFGTSADVDLGAALTCGDRAGDAW